MSYKVIGIGEVLWDLLRLANILKINDEELPVLA
jgi:hypothetical protein